MVYAQHVFIFITRLHTCSRTHKHTTLEVKIKSNLISLLVPRDFYPHSFQHGEPRLNATNLMDGQKRDWGDVGLACGLNCDWGDMLSLLWVFWLWCDGEVLRHSAALSCWHRKRAGWAVHGRPESGWITTGLVKFGLDWQLPGQWLLTEGGSYSAMELLAAWGLVWGACQSNKKPQPPKGTKASTKWGFMRFR